MAKSIITFLILMFLLVPLDAGAAPLMTHGYAAWLKELRQEAVANGVSEDVVDHELSGILPDPTVENLDQKQPEKTITFDQYLKNTITPQRVARGRELLEEHRELLEQVSTRFGVPPEIIVALWGMESSFGKNQGNFNVVRSLVTLAYEGRRADFFRKELLNALKIIDVNKAHIDELRGSWAGAMGQCQFMSSTYLNYAVDGDGDGFRDIWDNKADIFASIAHYLASEGWKGDLIWGQEVSVPAHVQKEMVGLGFSYRASEWAQLGVVIDNKFIINNDLRLSLVMPDGLGGRSFLVTDNYRAVMRWNRSTYFATAVGYLADRIVP